jgi:hypothetical protein
MTVSELASSGDSVIVDSVGAEIHVPWLITDNNTNAPYFTLSEEIITYNSDSYKIEYTIKP